MTKQNGGAMTTLEPQEIFKSANRQAQVKDGFACEVIRSLPEGSMIEGEYQGVGPSVEMQDPGTGEVRDVPTVRLLHVSGVVVNIPETAQLKRLRSVPVGKRVEISNLGQIDTRKGRRANDYRIDIETDAHFFERTGRHASETTFDDEPTAT